MLKTQRTITRTRTRTQYSESLPSTASAETRAWNAARAGAWQTGGAHEADRERELVLIARAQDGCREAMGELLRMHERFLHGEALAFRGRGVEVGDLVQEAGIGLMLAVERFDSSQDVRLLTYAQYAVRDQMREAVARQGRNIGCGVDLAKQVRQIQLAREALERESGREPSLAALSARTGIAEARLAELEVLVAEESAIDAPARGVAGRATVGDVLSDEDAPTPFEEVAAAQVRERVEAAIQGLKGERDRKIVRLLFGLETGEAHTLEQVGEMLGVSKERVRQIRVRVLQALAEAPGLRALWEDAFAASGERAA
jgi:RNA polymerase primary sigma factor